MKASEEAMKAEQEKRLLMEAAMKADHEKRLLEEKTRCEQEGEMTPDINVRD